MVIVHQMNMIGRLTINSSVWKGVVWDGKKIINRVNTNLIRLIIMQLVSETLLVETEKNQLVDLYITATNYEGDRTNILSKIIN